MAKKSTTGGPRPHRITDADLQRRREYLSRAERERLWQRRALIAVSVLVGISLLVLVVALVYENLIRPREAISTVNGETITTREYQDRVRFTRWEMGQQLRELYLLTGDINTVQQYASQLTNPIAIGSQVLDEMEEEILLKEEAEARGIVIDEAKINERVDDYMAQLQGLTRPGAPTATPTTVPSVTPTPLVSPTPSSTPSPTAPPPTATPAEGEAAAEIEATATPATEPTPTVEPTATATLPAESIQATLDKAEADYYNAARSAADVSREVVREVFYYDALRTALRDAIGADAPTEELQVHVRHILIAFDPDNTGQTGLPPTDEQKEAARLKADQVMAALQAGEPFVDLARSMSDDTGSAARGGEMDWQSPDTFVPAFADAVTNAEIGAIVGPVETEFGYHIIQVLGREVRALTDAQLNQRRSQMFTDWLAERKAAATIVRSDRWLDRIPDEPTYNQIMGDILPLQ